MASTVLRSHSTFLIIFVWLQFGTTTPTVLIRLETLEISHFSFLDIFFLASIWKHGVYSFIADILTSSFSYLVLTGTVILYPTHDKIHRDQIKKSENREISHKRSTICLDLEAYTVRAHGSINYGMH